MSGCNGRKCDGIYDECVSRGGDHIVAMNMHGCDTDSNPISFSGDAKLRKKIENSAPFFVWKPDKLDRLI